MRSGFVAVVGRPSVGKSSLINKLCAAKAVITSPVPQTTRNLIRAIVNHGKGQVVLTDTPGFHDSQKTFNLRLRGLVLRSLEDADAILYVLDASRPAGAEEKMLMELIVNAGKPTLVAVNKIDLPGTSVGSSGALAGEIMGPVSILGVSAQTGANLDKLIESLVDMCPVGPAHYPPDLYTDQSVEFRVAEIIREQVFLRTTMEVPHSLYVDISDMEFRQGNVLWVRAFLIVERSSQVGIIVGHKGEGIKAIRVQSIRELKTILPWKISLDLRVKVQPKWRKNSALVQRLIDPVD